MSKKGKASRGAKSRPSLWGLSSLEEASDGELPEQVIPVPCSPHPKRIIDLPARIWIPIDGIPTTVRCLQSESPWASYTWFQQQVGGLAARNPSESLRVAFPEIVFLFPDSNHKAIVAKELFKDNLVLNTGEQRCRFEYFTSAAPAWGCDIVIRRAGIEPDVIFGAGISKKDEACRALAAAHSIATCNDENASTSFISSVAVCIHVRGPELPFAYIHDFPATASKDLFHPALTQHSASWRPADLVAPYIARAVAFVTAFTQDGVGSVSDILKRAQSWHSTSHVTGLVFRHEAEYQRLSVLGDSDATFPVHVFTLPEDAAEDPDPSVDFTSISTTEVISDCFFSEVSSSPALDTPLKVSGGPPSPVSCLSDAFMKNSRDGLKALGTRLEETLRSSTEELQHFDRKDPADPRRALITTLFGASFGLTEELFKGQCWTVARNASLKDLKNSLDGIGFRFHPWSSTEATYQDELCANMNTQDPGVSTHENILDLDRLSDYIDKHEQNVFGHSYNPTAQKELVGEVAERLRGLSSELFPSLASRHAGILSDAWGSVMPEYRNSVLLRTLRDISASVIHERYSSLAESLGDICMSYTGVGPNDRVSYIATCSRFSRTYRDIYRQSSGLEYQKWEDGDQSDPFALAAEHKRRTALDLMINVRAHYEVIKNKYSEAARAGITNVTRARSILREIATRLSGLVPADITEEDALKYFEMTDEAKCRQTVLMESVKGLENDLAVISKLTPESL